MSNNSDMPFIDHLGEFSNRFFKVLVAHIIVMLLAFSQSGKILESLTSLNPNMQLVFIEPVEIMTTYIHISFVVAAAICMPFTIYQLWAFVAEGLYENEKMILKTALALGFIFFLIGASFAYFILVPTTLRFFTTIAIESVKPMISTKSYISFILTLIILMGIVFNMPSLTYLVTKFGLITPDTIKEYRKIIIVIIFIVGALVTPPDVISQMMVSLPMIALLQFSIFISERVYNKMNKGNVLEEK